MNTAKALAHVTDTLVRRLTRLRFAAPVAYTYNPLDYARPAWDEYCRRYAHPGLEAVFLGMNPGPFGMAQTGVPFGEVNVVRDWLQIEAPIGRPTREHAKRPITGFACPRSEVSGKRLWSWVASRFTSPEDFFRRFFVANYCPLVFMNEAGANLTPDKLPRDQRMVLFAACDQALQETVQILRARFVIGVGAFARTRAAEALDGLDVRVGLIPHPSPASPAANKGWAKLATAAMVEMGIEWEE